MGAVLSSAETATRSDAAKKKSLRDIIGGMGGTMKLWNVECRSALSHAGFYAILILYRTELCADTSQDRPESAPRAVCNVELEGPQDRNNDRPPGCHSVKREDCIEKNDPGISRTAKFELTTIPGKTAFRPCGEEHWGTSVRTDQALSSDRSTCLRSSSSKKGVRGCISEWSAKYTVQIKG